jgi:3-oxoacyl-[acyl-carrier protein] reductase
MFSIDLTGKHAWVTGGSRGIGREIALSLASAGCDVAVGYASKADEAKQVVAEIEKKGRKAVAVKADVADLAASTDAAAAVKAALGPVEILVNSAGVTRDNLFAMLEEEDWDAVLGVNVMGAVHVIKAVLPDMMAKRWGRIINLSSVAGTKGGRGQANYAASKGAIEAMTRSLAVELSRRNITVNAVAPGVIETDMSAEVRKLAAQEILDRQLVKRFGKPTEIAAWVVMLASDYGEFVTGQTFHLDGGLKMP